MGCELCGKDEPLSKALVEGTMMAVCKACGKFGKVLSAPAMPQKKVQQQKAEPSLDVVEDFAQKIRDAREKSGQTQKEFAMKLNEKESLLSKLETGAVKPSIPLAQKLEKLLKIKLVEQQGEGVVVRERNASGRMTIGDVIQEKVKK